MFHPLLPDMSTFKDADIDLKIAELSKKYSIAARSGDGGLCSQILMALDGFKAEQQRRFAEKTKVAVKNQDKDLGDLINVN
jgi:hypothetical protein